MAHIDFFAVAKIQLFFALYCINVIIKNVHNHNYCTSVKRRRRQLLFVK